MFGCVPCDNTVIIAVDVPRWDKGADFVGVLIAEELDAD
jgi:hypothetical protein